MHPDESGTRTDITFDRMGAELLLPQARALLERLRSQGKQTLLYPVSTLQGTFRLGYGRACVLSEALERLGEWRIGYDEDGVRFARLLAREGNPNGTTP